MRLTLVIASHGVLFVAIYAAAYLLRFDFEVPEAHQRIFIHTLPWVVAIKMSVFYGFRYFQRWSRHASFADLVTLVAAGLLSLLCIATANHFISQYFIPRVVLLLDLCGTILSLGALRSAWRLVEEHAIPLVRRDSRGRAILIGAEQADKVLAQRLQSYAGFPYNICGFLDRDAAKPGASIGSVQLLGTTKDLAAVIADEEITDVIAVSGSLPGSELRQVMGICEQANVKLQIIPPLAQMFRGNKQIPLKPIEITDLLRRDPVELDVAAIKRLFDQATVFVTGAGGSIGSEICRQLLEFPLKKLVLIERSEWALYKIEIELLQREPRFTIIPALGDVTDAARMRNLFEEFHPDVILHVAAHKHVPMLETHPGEAVKNNIFGTALMTDLAHEYEAGTFVQISTDKAVNPTSIMGVTKHICEEYVHAMSTESNTRCMVVRFGNVLGSSGSVVPLFQEQIRAGGPLTITHPEMKRFFMAIPEAAQLVLQAAAMGRGGEIFVLEMGEQVKIVDLAKDLIRLSGLPEHAIEIVFSGVRPGEKLYEELYFDDEEHMPTGHPKVMAAYHRPIELADVRRTLQELKALMDGEPGPLLQKLKEVVVEYVGSHHHTTPAELPELDGAKSSVSAVSA